MEIAEQYSDGPKAISESLRGIVDRCLKGATHCANRRRIVTRSTPPGRIHRRSIDVTDAQLDALEVRGYLDPDRCGDRTDECDAIEMFLRDSLNRR
jgi:hypothetical protein